MLIGSLAIALLALQAPAPGTELPTIKAALGSCSTDFTVIDPDGKPVYSATIHVRVRYGMMNIKRMDLEVSTNSAGKALVDGLPNKSKLLTYDISKDGRKATVEQDVSKECRATYEVTVR